MASSFSRPSIRNLSLQSLPPAGVTSRNMPFPSASLIAFAPGLALRMATSDKAMDFLASPGSVPPIYPQAWGYRVDRFAYTPQSYPQRLAAGRGRGGMLAAR
jgi:hypothetical protein